VISGKTRLSDRGGSKAIPEWRELSWVDCAECGERAFAPADEREHVYDGEPVICAECGLVGMTSVDEYGAHVNWVEEDEYALRPSALAAFRRLLDLKPYWKESIDVR
jgi:hypothetical protein